jgi:hypothetical protein
VCVFGTYVTMPFPSQLNPLLLRALGVEDRWIPAALTVAQSSEIATLALLPYLLSRLRLRPTMRLGIASWTFGLVLLAVGSPLALALLALATHGVYICCFLVAGQVFVNRQAGHECRASAQGLIQFFGGVGLLGGNLLVGVLRAATGDDFSLVYAPAALVSSLLVVVFTLGFTATEAAAGRQDTLVPHAPMS